MTSDKLKASRGKTKRGEKALVYGSEVRDLAQLRILASTVVPMNGARLKTCIGVVVHDGIYP